MTTALEDRVSALESKLSAVSQPDTLQPAGLTVDPSTGLVLPQLPPGWVDVRSYGAVGDGETDDTAAIQVAIHDAAGRLELFFPGPGPYLSGPLNADNLVGVRLTGPGGTSGGAAAGTTIVYTGAPTFFSARSVSGFTLDGIQVLYNNPAFNQLLFDFSHAPGGGGDANNIVFQNAALGGRGIRNAGTILASLDNAIMIAFRDVDFYNADTAVQGVNTAADYSNVVGFDNCQFTNFLSAPVKNPGQAWRFDSVIFEPLASGAAGAIASVLASAIGLTMLGCWMGDSSAAAGGYWVDLPLSAALFGANYISGGNVGINIHNGSQGIVAIGNSFNAEMSAAFGVGLNCYDLQLTPNFIGADVATPVSYAGGVPPGSLLPGGGPSQGVNALQRIDTGRMLFRDGVTTLVGADPITDASFSLAPTDGTLAATTDNFLWVRIGGAWRKVAVA